MCVCVCKCVFSMDVVEGWPKEGERIEGMQERIWGFTWREGLAMDLRRTCDLSRVWAMDAVRARRYR